MSDKSYIENVPRRRPKQERGEKRVAGLLDAAAEIFAETGYEAATMRDIADRADSCIGSLYQFFPNKEVVAQTLKNRYCQELQERFQDLTEIAPSISTQRLAQELVNVALVLLEKRPAMSALMDTPTVIKPAANIKESLLEQLMHTLQARKPQIQKSNARLYAKVTMHLIKELLCIYAETQGEEREALIGEIRMILTNYLELRL
jgi:AcrR family transcriptional regulator